MIVLGVKLKFLASIFVLGVVMKFLASMMVGGAEVSRFYDAFRGGDELMKYTSCPVNFPSAECCGLPYVGGNSSEVLGRPYAMECFM